MVATIAARRGPFERRRLATAHATKARLRTGIAKMGNNIPIAPFAIDTWMMRDVANSATIIRPTAPTRSGQGARLRNTHHTTIANPQKTPPITPKNVAGNPKNVASGATIGTTNLSSISSTAATTPGQSRSGFLSVDSSVCAMSMTDQYAPQQALCSHKDVLTTMVYTHVLTGGRRGVRSRLKDDSVRISGKSQNDLEPPYP